ncbi:MAG: hypothetical protein JW700_03255 [Candidatus Aenigmarchaeota archaeon]|nr:hypothetical protein [Candidatus Aenigmarchaeota archaeon]
MKTTMIATLIMFTLFSTMAFATSVSTDYEGVGEFSMEVTIASSVNPDITDSVHINAGCCGTCCCPNECCPAIGEIGEYQGNLFMTNNPFSVSYHSADVTEGCVDIDQYYTDVIGDMTIQSYYHTHLNGTGTAESYMFYVVPGAAASIQLANGTGTSHVSFGQIAYVGTDYDFSAEYGGTVWACAPGYAGLYNEYYYSGGQIYYSSQLGLYCSPTDGSKMSSSLFASSTDSFNLTSELQVGDVENCQEAGVENGTAEYGFTANFYDMFDDVYFGFDMILG